MTKFAEKTGGIIVMQYRFKRWWQMPAMWSICFAVLFGVDVASIDFTRPFDLYNLLEVFSADNVTTVVYPEILPVLISMLQNGLMSVTREQIDPESPLSQYGNGHTSPQAKDSKNSLHARQRPVTQYIDVCHPGMLPFP